MKKVASAVPALLLVAACGGGSGGGSGGGDDTVVSPNFVSFAETSADGTVVMSSHTKTASFSTDSVNGDYDLGALQSSDDATATVRYRNDLLSRLAISGSGADLTIDEDNGGQFYQDGFLVAGETADGNSAIAVVDPAAYSFNYQTFGYWSNGTNAGTVGVGSFGARTGASNMPTGTTASYTGVSVGILDTDGADYGTDSFVDVSTDFNNVIVVSYDTEIYDLETGANLGFAGDLDFTATGTISGDRFTALINEMSGTGTVTGQFYGPSAAEVGGTFEAAGSGGTYFGAFGAN